MKKVLLFAPAVLLAGHLNAQNVVGGAQGKGLDMQTGASGFVTELPPAPPETKGDVYLNSDWAVATIDLYQQGQAISQYPVRLNLQTNNIEINIQNQIKVLSGGRVKGFTMMNNKIGANETYKNANIYKLNGVPLRGFFRVIDSAKWELLSKAQVKLVEGAYVAALDAGDKNNKWVKEEVYFLAKDLNAYQVFPSSKKFCKQFNEREEAVKSFIKSNKINLKAPTDLIALMKFLGEADI